MRGKKIISLKVSTLVLLERGKDEKKYLSVLEILAQSFRTGKIEKNKMIIMPFMALKLRWFDGTYLL